ncbi:MAG: prolipoprotein diacylglyceryl transferase [Dehalococcoidales bacterium]
MNGIVISINPILFHIGGFEFRWYSLAIILAIVAAVLISASLAKKKGIATQEIYSLALWVVIAGIVGARLFHVIDQWQYYVGNPFQILQFQQGGLAIWGALAGGGAATIAYAMIRHIPLGRLVDAVAPALLTAQIIGRVGCIINGDAYGGVTNLPWGFIYTHPDALIPPNLLGLPTHPYPVYEMIWNASVLLVIWQLGHHFKKGGLVFLSYLSLYSLGRFALSFVRQESIILWGLQQAQIIAILALLASLLAIMYLAGKQLLSEKPAEP